MIIVQWWTAQGNTGACDHNCYREKPASRKQTICRCICGGANHGIGRIKACAQTRFKVPAWIKAFDANRPDDDKITSWTVTPASTTYMRQKGRGYDDPRFFYTDNKHYIAKNHG
jgi:hypothetical protein